MIKINRGIKAILQAARSQNRSAAILGLVFRVRRRIVCKAYSSWIRALVHSFGEGSCVVYPALIYGPGSISIGRHVDIQAHAWLNCKEACDNKVRLIIGDGSHIGRFVHINAWDSVVIEEEVLIAERVFITDYHHGHDDANTSIIRQPLTPAKPVRIKRGAWIGEGAVIMPGVTIGRNAIVGSNAVVTRDIPDGFTAHGIPARSVRRLTVDVHTANKL